MELLQLKYFKALAETENLTKTAEKLYLSTSALSTAITKLERELGSTLFDRSSGKSLRLNDRGRVLLTAVNQIMTTLSDTERLLDLMRRRDEASLSIATTTPMLFQDLFIQFKQEFPKVMFSHMYLNLWQLRDSDLLGQFDFIIASPDDFGLDDMESIVLYDNDYPMLLVYPEHRFAARDKVDLCETRYEPFIALNKELSSRKMFDEVFRRSGFAPQIIFECDHLMREKLIMEKQGIGLSTFQTKCCNPQTKLVFVELANYDRYRRVQALFWHRQRALSPLSKAFHDFTVHYYRQISEDMLLDEFGLPWY